MIILNRLKVVLIISFTLIKVRQVISQTVLITNPTVPTSGIHYLEDKGMNVIIVDKEGIENILEKVKGVDAIWWASGLKLDKEVFDAAGPQMKTVGVMSGAFHHVDIDEMKKRGIKAGNTPVILDDAVADVAVLLTLAVSRRLKECVAAIEHNFWPTNDWQWLVGRDIYNSTLGIIGMGSVGQAILRRFQGFSFREYLYTGAREREEIKDLAKLVSLNTLLTESDYVIVAIPYTKETEMMCDKSFFAKMKKTAIFINISKSSLVDQDALIEALKTGVIYGAGLDVVNPEPLPSCHQLATMKNVVVLPHVGSATNMTRERMSTLTAINIVNGLTGVKMLTDIVQ